MLAVPPGEKPLRDNETFYEFAVRCDRSDVARIEAAVRAALKTR